jgi:hypothetical protein
MDRVPPSEECCCRGALPSSTTKSGCRGQAGRGQSIHQFRPGNSSCVQRCSRGSAASVLSITFGLSYALLIFSGPLAPYLSYGVAATFIASTVLAGVIALGSSLPFAVGGA